MKNDFDDDSIEVVTKKITKRPGTLLPEVSEYKIEPINFFDHAADPKTWPAWQLALRMSYAPHGVSGYNRDRLEPADIMDEKNNGNIYKMAQIALLVNEGHTYPGAIAKKLGISVCEAIYLIKNNHWVKQDDGKIKVNNPDRIFSVDKLVDPRAVVIVQLHESRYSPFWAIAVRRMSSVEYKHNYGYKKYGWQYWSVVRPALHRHNVDDKTLAYAYLCAYLFEHTQVSTHSSYGVFYDNKKKVFDVHTTYFDEKNNWYSPIYLKKSRDRATGGISLTLMRDKQKIENLTWFSNVDRVVAMFVNETKIWKAAKEAPKKPVFNNEDICCGS
jgi:hypothetical protein